jgi:peroxiredoxin
MSTKVPPRPKPGASRAPRPVRQSEQRPTGAGGSATPRAERSLKARQAQRARQRNIWVASAVVVVAAVAGLYIATNGGAKKAASAYPYQVGQPGPGQQAPDFTLASTSGGTWSLAAQKGKTVLLFFQEGIGCEPCWTQIKDMESDWAPFRSLGINEMVSITSDPMSALQQKVGDEGISTPLLADTNLAVSNKYDMTAYAMAGMANADGHSFVVVGPTGNIEWRGDYGGAPNYTMFVPNADLLAQMKAGSPGGQAL